VLQLKGIARVLNITNKKAAFTFNKGNIAAAHLYPGS
jgi:hypothetical protein